MSTLTKRQIDVLRLMGAGESPKGIATALNLSVKTVDIHLARARKTLGLRDGLLLRARAARELTLEELGHKSLFDL